MAVSAPVFRWRQCNAGVAPDGAQWVCVREYFEVLVVRFQLREICPVWLLVLLPVLVRVLARVLVLLRLPYAAARVLRSLLLPMRRVSFPASG